MNAQLGNSVHLRLFRFQIGALKKREENGRWILVSGPTTVALATEAQVDGLIVLLDNGHAAGTGKCQAGEVAVIGKELRASGPISRILSSQPSGIVT